MLAILELVVPSLVLELVVPSLLDPLPPQADRIVIRETVQNTCALVLLNKINLPLSSLIFLCVAILSAE